jgi:hypothetical protein
MPFARGYSAAEAQLLITLSGLAYLDSDPLPGETVEAQQTRMRRDIDAALADSAYSTWRVVWGPGLSGDRANMLYAAADSSNGQVAVAVRGTDWSFWLDWVENFASVLPLVPFTAVVPSVTKGAPMIAAGTNLGLQLLLSTQASDVDGQTMNLADFLSGQGSGTEVFFTGHSLGGCLASVLAPSLAYQLGSSSNFKVYTFAAPSAGNRDFAEYVDRLFSADAVSTAFRVFNDLDIVPMSWATLLSIAAVYLPAPACTAQMKALIDWAQVRVAGEYQQPASAVELHGQVQPIATAPGTESRDNVEFFTEVDYQHGTETYMQLMAAPVTPTLLAKLRAALSTTARVGGGAA